MPDKKLTDNEIIKALESCSKSSWLNDCDGCPCFDPKEDIQTSECQERIMKYALDLINRLQSQNKDLAETIHNLTLEKDALFDKLDKLKSEVNRYSINNHEYANCVGIKNGLIYTHTLDDYENFIEDVSNIAVKDFAERLKNEIINDTAYACDSTQHSGYYDYQIKIGDIPEYIDNLLKEMVGEDK